jgi:cysteine desulfurase
VLGLPPVSDPALERPDPLAGTTRYGQTPTPRVYLEYAASTPCDPAVADLMRRIAVHEFANPSSSHRAGQRAAQYVETAREQVAAAINALPEDMARTQPAPRHIQHRRHRQLRRSRPTRRVRKDE